MYYGVINPSDVPEESKNAAYEALKIAQGMLDIPENFEIVFFSEMNTAEKYNEHPERFVDDLEYRLKAKSTGGKLYVNFSQYAEEVKKSVLAGCWIMEVNKNGNIYSSPYAQKTDRFYQHLEEDAEAFADKVMKEIRNQS